MRRRTDEKLAAVKKDWEAQVQKKLEEQSRCFERKLVDHSRVIEQKLQRLNQSVEHKVTQMEVTQTRVTDAINEVRQKIEKLDEVKKDLEAQVQRKLEEQSRDIEKKLVEHSRQIEQKLERLQESVERKVAEIELTIERVSDAIATQQHASVELQVGGSVQCTLRTALHARTYLQSGLEEVRQKVEKLDEVKQKQQRLNQSVEQKVDQIEVAVTRTSDAMDKLQREVEVKLEEQSCEIHRQLERMKEAVDQKVLEKCSVMTQNCDAQVQNSRVIEQNVQRLQSGLEEVRQKVEKLEEVKVVQTVHECVCCAWAGQHQQHGCLLHHCAVTNQREALLDCVPPTIEVCSTKMSCGQMAQILAPLAAITKAQKAEEDEREKRRARLCRFVSVAARCTNRSFAPSSAAATGWKCTRCTARLCSVICAGDSGGGVPTQVGRVPQQGRVSTAAGRTRSEAE